MSLVLAIIPRPISRPVPSIKGSMELTAPKGLEMQLKGGGGRGGNEGGYILETSPNPGADRRLGLGSEELSILHLKPYR